MKKNKHVLPAPKQGNKIYNRESSNHTFLLFIILAVTALIYFPSLSAKFTNWDDDKYVVNNALIKQLSFSHIKAYFTGYFDGHYHPLTLLSLAVDRALFKLNPAGYHAHNVLLHLINTALVFWLILSLTRKASVALITATLFGIHPIHVESVAWVTDRKDLLCTTYFLASLLSYSEYINREKKLFYGLSLFFFIISLFAKAAAVPLSLTIIAIDYLKGRSLKSRNIILEKIPFLILSLVFGIVSFWAQDAATNLEDDLLLKAYQRLPFAGYGYIMYLIKMIVPFGLSAFYPYPEEVPFSHWLCTIAAAGILIVAILKINSNRALIFGIVFFTVNILFVLQLVQVGNVIMADRYSYIPSIGFFFLIGTGYHYVQTQKQVSGTILTSVFVIYSLVLAVVAYRYVNTWHDSIALWDNALEQEEYHRIYYNRGNARNDARDPLGAEEDYTQAISLKENAYYYGNRGAVRNDMQNYEGAMKDYTRAIELRPQMAHLYYNRGLANVRLNNYREAVADFTKTIELKANFEPAYFSRAVVRNTYLKSYREAIADFTEVIRLNPSRAEAFLNRGNAENSLNDFAGAEKDYTSAIVLKPDYGDAYFNRGLVMLSTSNKENACADFKQALLLGNKTAEQIMKQYCMK